ncbi:MAG: class I SAM-dependent RNA methyltransferase [Deltaproteobacteria bacterium]|nr:class I SAM-dependent RNA methyltransferase [Deltaproteobacteria bacterium]
MQVLMPIKEQLHVTIESVAFGGQGVARAGGLVIFVGFAAPGDVLRIEIVERKKKFARGRLIKVIEPSPMRTEPLCPYYGRCGGCSYQHIDYARQLDIKRRQIGEALERIGGLAKSAVLEVIPSPRTYAYRGKAELHAAGEAGRFRLGFMDISGGRLVDIERCAIMDETINDRIREAREAGRVPQDPADLIFWSGPPAAAGEAISRTVKNKDFHVPRTGFFQTNLYLTDRMVDVVCGLIDRKVETIVDACCGSGLFSLFLSPYARRVVGIEINDQSVKYARINARRHGVPNVEFIQGDVEEVLADRARLGEAVDLVLLDPPRAGLSAASLAAVWGLKALDIIYISCNPATQARDIKFLKERGYDLQSVQPLDMFAQTEHIETVALLRLR